jgi:hypothetical protein
MKRILILSVFLGLAACGKQGPPRPPVPMRPAAATDLVVAQRGPTVVLSWSFPALAASGVSLDRLDSLNVYRLREQVPAELRDSTAVEIDITSGSVAPRAIELFERVPPVSPESFRVMAEKIGEVSREDIPSFTSGAMVVMEDRPRLLTETGESYRYTYGVTASRGRNESDMSNLQSIVTLDVPLPPEQPKVEPAVAAVVLRWNPPERTVTGSDPHIVGYNVYRLPATRGGILTASPVNESPVQTTEYSDTPPYGSWRYAVTAVHHAGPPVHESQFTLLSTVEFADRQPPPTPEELSPLVEERVIRLIWTGVDAPDLAGYRVYRQAAGQPHELLTPDPVTRTLFVDERPEPGVEYRYGVTSVDTSGNQSEPVVTELVLIPREPR